MRILSVTNFEPILLRNIGVPDVQRQELKKQMAERRSGASK